MKGEKQMNEIQTSCASTDRKWNTWESIDWNKSKSFAVGANALVLR